MATRIVGRSGLLAVRVPIATRAFCSTRVVRNDDEVLQRIKGDLKEAMKSKDSFTSTVLRVSKL